MHTIQEAAHSSEKNCTVSKHLLISTFESAMTYLHITLEEA